MGTKAEAQYTSQSWGQKFVHFQETSAPNSHVCSCSKNPQGKEFHKLFLPFCTSIFFLYIYPYEYLFLLQLCSWKESEGGLHSPTARVF